MYKNASLVRYKKTQDDLFSLKSTKILNFKLKTLDTKMVGVERKREKS